MQTGGGVALIVAGTGLGLVVVFVLWHRLSPRSATVLLGAFGMMVGAGALLLQEEPGRADWLVALAVLAVGTPLHFRWLLGPPGSETGGREARGDRMVAARRNGA